MNLLILGRGKTGSLVAEVAAERKHHVQSRRLERKSSLRRADPRRPCKPLTPSSTSRLRTRVLAHIEACVKAGKNMVVGTTGWYDDVDRIRALVEQHNTGFVYAANFSVGVNLFFDVARAAAAALRHDYSGQIFERHHVHKKDAPSGTAIAIQQVIREASGHKEGLEITSFREGDVVGLHEVVLESPPTASTSATTPNPAAASPKAPSAPPNGSPAKKASTISKMCGESL